MSRRIEAVFSEKMSVQNNRNQRVKSHIEMGYSKTVIQTAIDKFQTDDLFGMKEIGDHPETQNKILLDMII